MPAMTPDTLKTICEVHDKYWEDKRRDLYAYKQCYETDFWDKSETYGMGDWGITIQTSDDGSYGSADFRVNGFSQLMNGVATGDGDVVINEGGGSYDFRVESDDHTHMLFVSGAGNQIGIGFKNYDSSRPRDLVHIRQGDYTKSAGLRIEHLMDNGETYTNSGSIIFSSLNSTTGVDRTALAEITIEPLGNLVLSASKQDTDIIFKVNDGGSSRELMRMDGSTSQVLILSGGDSTSYDEAAGTDVAFYVSGTVGSQGTATRGTSLIGGDMAVSGTIAAGLAGSQTAITTYGDILPATNDTYDLGSDSKRFQNIYTGDLHLRNDRGDWTIVEEEDYLCVVNNKSGKKFKMALIPLDED